MKKNDIKFMTTDLSNFDKLWSFCVFLILLLLYEKIEIPFCLDCSSCTLVWMSKKKFKSWTNRTLMYLLCTCDLQISVQYKKMPFIYFSENSLAEHLYRNSRNLYNFVIQYFFQCLKPAQRIEVQPGFFSIFISENKEKI